MEFRAFLKFQPARPRGLPRASNKLTNKGNRLNFDAKNNFSGKKYLKFSSLVKDIKINLNRGECLEKACFEKKITLCSCKKNELSLSSFEIFDVIALMFNVRICVVQQDESNLHLLESYFGSEEAPFKFYIFQKSLVGKQFQNVISQLEKMLTRLMRSSGVSSEARARVISQKLNKIRRVETHFTNFVFKVLNFDPKSLKNKRTFLQTLGKQNSISRFILTPCNFALELDLTSNARFADHKLLKNRLEKMNLDKMLPSLYWEVNDYQLPSRFVPLVRAAFCNDPAVFSHFLQCRKVRKRIMDLNMSTKRVTLAADYVILKKSIFRRLEAANFENIRERIRQKVLVVFEENETFKLEDDLVDKKLYLSESSVNYSFGKAKSAKKCLELENFELCDRVIKAGNKKKRQNVQKLNNFKTPEDSKKSGTPNHESFTVKKSFNGFVNGSLKKKKLAKLKRKRFLDPPPNIANLLPSQKILPNKKKYDKIPCPPSNDKTLKTNALKSTKKGNYISQFLGNVQTRTINIRKPTKLCLEKSMNFNSDRRDLEREGFPQHLVNYSKCRNLFLAKPMEHSSDLVNVFYGSDSEFHRTDSGSMNDN